MLLYKSSIKNFVNYTITKLEAKSSSHLFSSKLVRTESETIQKYTTNLNLNLISAAAERPCQKNRAAHIW